MARREYRFNLNPEDEEEEVEEERDMDDTDESDVDIEGVEDDNEMRHNEMRPVFADDNGHVGNLSNGTSMNSLAGDDDDRLIDVEEDEEEDDDDAMTWESLSTISVAEVEQLDNYDEWYPMAERKTMFPNFALPTTTRQALEPHPNYHYESVDVEETSSESGDVEFQSYVEVMRPEPTKKEIAGMVLDYFLHHGHAEVIETFCKEMDLPMPVEEIKEMETRNDVKNSILEGKMEEALEKINAISPDIIKEDLVHFEFRKQHMIEMIRSGLSLEAVAYFREHLMVDGQRPCDERMEILEQIFTLMVFDDGPSPFQMYYEQKEREKTAKEVNSAILGILGKPRFSRIDMLAKSMVWVQNELHNTMNPNQKTTTLEWATKFFDTPFGFNELIEKEIKREPLDMTKEFS